MQTNIIPIVELRLKVYEEILNQNWTSANATAAPAGRYNPIPRQRNAMPAILEVSKSVREEALFLYLQEHLYMDLEDEFKFWLWSCRPLTSRITAIRRLQVGVGIAISAMSDPQDVLGDSLDDFNPVISYHASPFEHTQYTFPQVSAVCKIYADKFPAFEIEILNDGMEIQICTPYPLIKLRTEQIAKFVESYVADDSYGTRGEPLDGDDIIAVARQLSKYCHKTLKQSFVRDLHEIFHVDHTELVKWDRKWEKGQPKDGYPHLVVSAKLKCDTLQQYQQMGDETTTPAALQVVSLEPAAKETKAGIDTAAPTASEAENTVPGADELHNSIDHTTTIAPKANMSVSSVEELQARFLSTTLKEPKALSPKPAVRRRSN
jgi:hypothetical protein